jgi:uncharacterized protein (DUF1800 family)
LISSTATSTPQWNKTTSAFGGSEMSGTIKNNFFIAILGILFIFIGHSQSNAQGDVIIDSPIPVLISESESTRALSNPPLRTSRAGRGTFTPRGYQPGQDVTVFVSNLSLMNGEGSNSVRVYGEDSRGRVYRFPVVDFGPVPDMEHIQAVTVRLSDEIGYFPAPIPDGDMLISLSWRGNSSNKVRLAFGRSGGKISDEPGAIPTPLSKAKAISVQVEDAFSYTSPRVADDITRFLQQASFGPSSASYEQVRRLGPGGWLSAQFKRSYSAYEATFPEFVLKPLDSAVGCPTGGDANCVRDHYSMYNLQNWFFRQAVYGDDQLRHRVAWALHQIWVTSGIENYQVSWMVATHKILTKHAFGNWRNLMYDMTLNPGMGNYLDMMRSTRTNPNENYPREILQLFNVGLFLLNQDGTVQRDGAGNPIDTYSQEDVNNFTKVMTGWTRCEVTGCLNRTTGAPNYKDPMILTTGNHDLTAKTLLDYPGAVGKNIAACAGCTGTAITNYANNSLNQALDNIYYHPNTAPFVSRLLIQQLVTSDPSPAYVERVANVFTANKTNPTQMREVIKAILLDPEARGNKKTDPRYGKLREPVLLVTNLMRQFDAKSNDLLAESDGVVNSWTNGIGQDVFRPVTVFNYYPMDYMVPGTTLPGPEFGIFTTGTAIGRLNNINTMAFGSLSVAATRPNGTRLDYRGLQTTAKEDPTSNKLMDNLNSKMMHGRMSPEMREQIRTAVNAVTGTTDTIYMTRAQTAVYLIATSSQWQIQR